MVSPNKDFTPPPPADAKANDIQHGGRHYKGFKIQPWDYIIANNIPYMEASAIVYITRWREKGGTEDLLKAKHYIDKILEVEEATKAPPFRVGDIVSYIDRFGQTSVGAIDPMTHGDLVVLWDGTRGEYIRMSKSDMREIGTFSKVL